MTCLDRSREFPGSYHGLRSDRNIPGVNQHEQYEIERAIEHPDRMMKRPLVARATSQVNLRRRVRFERPLHGGKLERKRMNRLEEYRIVHATKATFEPIPTTGAANR